MKIETRMEMTEEEKKIAKEFEQGWSEDTINSATIRRPGVFDSTGDVR